MLARDSKGKENEVLAAILLWAAAAPELPLSEFSHPPVDFPDPWPAPEHVRPYVARPQIEARVPANMRWSAEDTPIKIYEKTMFRVDLCIFGNARRFALKTTEPAAAIAEAALGNCASWRPALTSAAFEMIRSLSSAEQTTADYFENRRQRAIAMVMETRVAARRP